MRGEPEAVTWQPVARPGRVTDIPAIYRGELGSTRQWEPQHESAWQAGVEQHFRLRVENVTRLTAAGLDEQVAGYSLWDDEEGRAELCTQHVSEAYRRRGIGQALVEAYVESARQTGFEMLSLDVRADHPARRLYEHAGFGHVGANALGYLRYELQAAD